MSDGAAKSGLGVFRSLGGAAGDWNAFMAGTPRLDDLGRGAYDRGYCRLVGREAPLCAVEPIVPENYAGTVIGRSVIDIATGKIVSAAAPDPAL